MCGIYFCAAHARPPVPQIFENRVLCKKCLDSGPVSVCFRLGKDDIRQLVENDRERRTQLDQESLRKIDALPRLRSLQVQLHAAKNANNAGEVLRIQLLLDALQNTSQRACAYSTNNALLAVLTRGPEFAQYVSFLVGTAHCLLLSSVLSLRQPFTEQPAFRDDLVLQYNGELYMDGCMRGNDTFFLFQRVLRAVAATSNALQRTQAILAAFLALDGEYAFVLTDRLTKTVYFGKDTVGKRSLLYCCDDNAFLVASVLPNKTGEVTECKGGVIYSTDLRNLETVAHEVDAAHHMPIPANLSLSVGTVARRAEALHAALSRSCLVRQDTIQPLEHDSEILVGVLFSGGLDCTVVAALVAQNYITQNTRAAIDLLTVGFENPRTAMGPTQLPDRALAEKSWAELCSVFSGTCVSFRLVKIDVSYELWLRHKKVVQELIHPTNTEMDLSIAGAFYFACRSRNSAALQRLAEGIIAVENYSSQAKVLFSGLGADELFGGYSRHEKVFNSCLENDSVMGFYDTLSGELAAEIDFIYVRNLGRDDRAMCSWGKELRYPFLDRQVIRHAFEEIEPNLKVRFEWVDQTTKKGVSRLKRFERKYILRQVARSIGLTVAAEEPKRAIQFGAKTAKMEIGTSKAKGTDSL